MFDEILMGLQHQTSDVWQNTLCTADSVGLLCMKAYLENVVSAMVADNGFNFYLYINRLMWTVTKTPVICCI